MKAIEPRHAKARADIVIVNWNSGTQLRDCLESVAAHAEGVGKVIVVDNDSEDGSAALSVPSLDLTIVQSGANLGFAGGCNLGATLAQNDYLLFLNPDTMLTESSVARAVAFLESEAGQAYGICGIRLLDSLGRAEGTCANFVTPRSIIGHATGLNRLLPSSFPPHFPKIDYSRNQPVDQPSGAFFLIRRHVFERLNGFDPRYFMYFDEADLSLRASEIGWGRYLLGEASAFHKGGGVSERVKAHRLFYTLRSRILFSFKHFSRPIAWGMVATTVLLEPISRLAWALGRWSGEDAVNTVRAYLMLAKSTPATIRTARGIAQGGGQAGDAVAKR